MRCGGLGSGVGASSVPLIAGMLFGAQTGRRVEIFHSFEMPVSRVGSQPTIDEKFITLQKDLSESIIMEHDFFTNQLRPPVVYLRAHLSVTHTVMFDRACTRTSQCVCTLVYCEFFDYLLPTQHPLTRSLTHATIGMHAV